MQLRNILRCLAIGSLVVLFSTADVKAKGNPFKLKIHSEHSAASNEFVCGTYKGSEKEILWHYYQYQAKMKSLQKTSARLTSRVFDFHDVAVIEDDGTLLTSGVNLFDTDNQTFHFVPNANGGYDVTNVTFAFDSDFGTDLSLGDDTNTTINIPFTFNYYGGGWNDIHINANGIVSFGGDINPSGAFDNNDFVSVLPKIAAYFMDLNPEEPGAPADGGVFAKSEANKVTITWNKLPEFGTSKINTVQMILNTDGSINVSFNGITSLVDTDNNTPITFGLHPQGMPNLEIISFSDDLPFSGPAGAGIFETYLDLQNPRVNVTALMNRFYQTYPDSFFQIIFFTNFTQTMLGFANERTIKNDVEGIGSGTFDFSSFFGSNGVLESQCNMNQIDVWPTNPEERFFSPGNNNFLTIMGQETGHRWGAFVNFVDTNGDTSNLILGRGDAHWSYYFDSDHSSLEGGNWEFDSGNLYRTLTDVDFFSELDEYLLGLRRPEEVSPSFFLSSFSNNSQSNRDQGTPLKNATATGTAVEVTIENIIAAEGPRIPAEQDAPKDLRQAFILIIKNGNTPSQADLGKIENFRRTWEDYFERSVDGRMTLNTSVTRTFPVAVISGHVLDDVTGQPIENIMVKSTERGFKQWVPGGGRYTFRYLANENSGAEEAVTIVVEAKGYFSDTLPINITYGTEMVSDFRLQLDLTPAITTTSVLQNPAASKYADIVVVADRLLQSEPIVQIAAAGDTTTVTMSLLPGASSAYSGSFEFTETGAHRIYTIAVSATNGVDSTQSRVFSIALAKPGIPTIISTMDNKATLKINEEAIQSETYFMADSGELDGDDFFSFGPKKEFTTALTLEIDYNDADFNDPGKIFIYQRRGDEWVALETRVFPALRKARANVSMLGKFKIASDADFGGTNLVPENFSLSQNYPNPFNPTTIIEYALPVDAFVELVIFNALGQAVKTLHQGRQFAGTYQVSWDGTDKRGNQAASGIFFYRIKAGNFVKTQKMILLR